MSSERDPRTPILVGTAQENVTEGDVEPIELMARVSEAALRDSGSDNLRSHIGSLRTVKGIWPYKDPSGLVAQKLGLEDAQTVMAPQGGNEFYDLANATAAAIQRGELDAALIFSAETMRTRRRDHKAGRRSPYLEEREGAAPDLLTSPQLPMASDSEAAAKLNWPMNFYAMADVAIRHRNGESVAEHRKRISELWAAGAAVAATNPHAAITTGPGASTIAEPSDTNRMVTSPYPKLMTSNINVDQGAAVVMCSVATAEAAGVPRDRWVFPWSGSGAKDTHYTTNRWALDESAPMRLAGQRAMALAGVTFEDIDFMDLYSCFPAAVQVAQRELGIDPATPWTITGGLTFAGGPMNAYCLHALATAVTMLRERSGQTALLTGNGGYFTKQSVMVLGSEPADAFRYERAQEDVDALPTRPDPYGTSTNGTIETYTLNYGRSVEPEVGIIAVLDADGRRTYGHNTEPTTMTALLESDLVGSPVHIDRTTAVPTIEIIESV